MPGLNKKYLIISFFILFLLFGSFQTADALTKEIGETFTATAYCEDEEGLSRCNIAICDISEESFDFCLDNKEVSNQCLIHGQNSGTCSVEFTCYEAGDYDVCGEAIDTKGLKTEKCFQQKIFCTDVTCWEETENFDSGCELLKYYDEDKDERIGLFEILKAVNDYVFNGLLTNGELFFLKACYEENLTIDEMCPGCIWRLSPCYPHEDIYGYGDINGDGKITKLDSQLIAEYSVDIVQLNEAQKERADVNNDGELNASDSMMIEQYRLTLPIRPTFPVCNRILKIHPSNYDLEPGEKDWSDAGYDADGDGPILVKVVSEDANWTSEDTSVAVVELRVLFGGLSAEITAVGEGTTNISAVYDYTQGLASVTVGESFYCGDGVCDSDEGEDEWNCCPDCGNPESYCDENVYHYYLCEDTVPIEYTECNKEECGGCEQDSDCPCGEADGCQGRDYYDYPDYGNCDSDCQCDIGTSSGEPCEPEISYNSPLCGECTPGETEDRNCGSGHCLGTQDRTCDSEGNWGSWSDCSSEGDTCGTKSDDCEDYCSGIELVEYNDNCLEDSTAIFCDKTCNASGICQDCSLPSCPDTVTNCCIGLCGAVCEVEGVCRTPVDKACTADDARDNDISQMGDSIDDYWCTYNVHDGCEYVASKVQLVNGQVLDDCCGPHEWWEGESCDYDSSGGSSILWGEKKVFVDDIKKYKIEAGVKVDDNSWVWINDKAVPEFRLNWPDGKDWTNLVDVTSYFHTGDNTVKFKAEDTCSGERYFDMQWNVSPAPGLPIAAISCDPESCQTYRKPESMDPVFTLKNETYDSDGDDDIEDSKWYKKDREAPDGDYELILDCPYKCDCTLQIDVVPGKYTARLKVKDSTNNISWATKDFRIKRDISADFMCSLFESGPWQDCSTFKGIEGEYAYFKDAANLEYHSVGSEKEDGGEALIVSRNWELIDQTDPLEISGEFDEIAKAKLKDTDNKIKLRVVDSAGRDDEKVYDLNPLGLPLPTWKEIK
jgi:hypothetical protein